jgi:4-aminobutyrate aminotransferase
MALSTRVSHIVRGVSRLNPSITAASAAGVWLTDTRQRKYIDLTSGIGALSTGHCHPQIVQHVQSQVATLVHAQQNCVNSHVAATDFLTELSNTALPDRMDQLYFSNSGTDAVENAMKLARKATGRPNIVSFVGGFHGRSFGGMSVSTAKSTFRQGFHPLLAGVHHLPYPQERDGHVAVEAAIKSVTDLFERQSTPSDTAAFLLEPILGEGGLVRMHKDFAKHLRTVCDTHGILLIADEVQTGCGRVGTWWAHEHWGKAATPDIVTFGKGVASGYPFAGVIARKELFFTIHLNGLGGTYNGNAVCAAAAAETLRVLRPLLPDVSSKGERIAHHIRNMQLPIIKEVRQYGLMIAIELNISDEMFKELMRCTSAHGLLVLTAGITPTVRLMPPLTITNAEIDEGMERLHKWLSSSSAVDPYFLVI